MKMILLMLLSYKWDKNANIHRLVINPVRVFMKTVDSDSNE